MLFVNYREIEILGVAIALVLLGFGCYRFLRPIKHPFVRQSLRLIAVGIGSLSLLPLALAGCGLLLTTNSKPIFSPDRQYAVRVTDMDGGGLGGDTAVSVYGAYGLKNDVVLYGLWKIVDVNDVSWKSKSEVLIQYPTTTGYDPPNCKDFGKIKVTCVPRAALLGR